MKKVFTILVIALILFFGAGAWYLHGINQKNSALLSKKKFVIETGQTSEQISHNLKAAGLIRSTLLFDFYTWRQGLDNQLKAGEYEIPQNLTLTELIHLLNTATSKAQKKITIIEGWKNTDIADYLAKENIVTSVDFMAAVSKKRSWWDEYAILRDKPKNLDSEGYLFPDTYLIYANATTDDIVRKMLDTMEQKITPEMRSEILRQKKTIHEILTLASIIEKEVSGGADRKVVAGIFYKRLGLGMALQADSTVNYVTGKSSARSSLDDISLDNPYNTYKYAGLPPGPISAPGLTAIMAAIYPTTNPYLYFLTTPEGKVIYSKTFDEHIAAKHKYLK